MTDRKIKIEVYSGEFVEMTEEEYAIAHDNCPNSNLMPSGNLVISNDDEYKFCYCEE